MNARLLMLMLLVLGQKENAESTRSRVIPPQQTCQLELSLSDSLAKLGSWKDAEEHYLAASKDAECQQQALAALAFVKRNEGGVLLQIGQIYESQNQWSKAEEIYKAAASDAALPQAERESASELVKVMLNAQAREKQWSELTETFTEGAKAIAFLVAIVLMLYTLRSIWKSRNIILIHPFEAPTDELARGLSIQLKFARIAMNNPTFSSAAQVPPILIENLRFADEIEPIEDLEIAGSKVPFSSLGRLFGQPRVRVTGGFDGIGPTAWAYSVVEVQDSGTAAFIQREIRMGVPSQQRVDTLNFAYDVVVRASST